MSQELNRLAILNRNAVRYGFATGCINVFVSLIGWLVNPLFFIKQIAAGFIVTVLLLVLQRFFLRRIRKALGKLWTFGEAFRASMIMALVSVLMYSVWMATLHNVLDRSLGSRMTEASIQKTTEMLESFGAGARADEQIDKMRQLDTNPGHLTNLLKQFLATIAFWAVASLGFAAALKRSKPVFK